MKAERGLAKVEECLKPAEQREDPESITDEERFMFRKLGLKMTAFLLLGKLSITDECSRVYFTYVQTRKRNLKCCSR